MKVKKLSKRQHDNELDNAIAELAQKVAVLTEKNDTVTTDICGLMLRRIDTLTELSCYLHEPSVCFTVQGAKRVLLGDEAYVYDSHHFLLSSIDLPIMAKVIEAPYLGIIFKIDLQMISQLMADSNLPLYAKQSPQRGMALSEISLPIIQAFYRLIGLLGEPEDIPILAPLIQREIHYRLLMSDQGPQLRQIAGGQRHQIARALEWLKNNFDKSLRVDDLADYVSMSASSFHHHFREFTAMTPLQYQKKLRLYEARRLMLTENLDAATTAFQVGYESPSQFSREYSRLFGMPPAKDIKTLHQFATDE